MSNYSEKLKDPRWQKKRLEIMQRDKWKCQGCGDKTSTLHVHHMNYVSRKEPWGYPDKYLITLCSECHAEEHSKQLSGDVEDEFDECSKLLKLKFINQLIKENFLSSELSSLLYLIDIVADKSSGIDIEYLRIAMDEKPIVDFLNITGKMVDEDKTQIISFSAGNCKILSIAPLK